VPKPQREHAQIIFSEECGLQPGCILETHALPVIGLVEFDSIDVIDLTETGVLEIAFRPQVLPLGPDR
jgi:hypothetical protein